LFDISHFGDPSASGRPEGGLMSDSVRHIMVVASTAITVPAGAIPAHYVPARAHFSYRSPRL